MTQKTKHELELSQLKKSIFTAIRLKHSLAADAEINSRAPAILQKAEQAILSGKPLTLTMAEVLEETGQNA